MDEILKISGAAYDETRIMILAFLIANGECCVCELTASLGLGQSRISRHVGILQEAGFLTVRRDGKWMKYSLTHEPHALIRTYITSIKSLSLTLPEKINACELAGDEG